jgi:undecaprenyl diphosphate synthase
MNNPFQSIPTHVAIICDGNRRWAKENGLAAVMGHQHAAKTVFEPLVDTAIELGISYVTFWVFSTENWQRSPAEVKSLLEMLRQQLDHYSQSLNERQVRIQTIGDLTKFPADIQEKIHKAKEKTAANTGLTVVFALNYGGRDELTRSIKEIAIQVQNGSLNPEDISSEVIGNVLDTAAIPDPELIIRTGGEQRLSGFLPWQAVFAEYAFPKVFFPDLSPALFKEIIKDFGTRQRRFGH